MIKFFTITKNLDYEIETKVIPFSSINHKNLDYEIETFVCFVCPLMVNRSTIRILRIETSITDQLTVVNDQP